MMDLSSIRVSRPAAVLRTGLELRRPSLAVALVFALVTAPVAVASEQQRFASPEAAADAFGNAVVTSDMPAMRTILGPDMRRYIPPQNDEATLRFLEAWAKGHKVVAAGPDKALLEVGTDGWTLPIPIVKAGAGWRFDTKAGAEEMRIRRIGRNELAAEQVILAIYDAQREYATRNPDGAYAPKIASAPGRKDGLYWKTGAGENPSPLGQLVAEAQTKGYAKGSGYHGYHYRILTAQGPHAAGGAFDYQIRGKMIGGFAIVAWPVKYGDTGVMTFMTNYNGVVYQKDLGPQTAEKVHAIKRFDPDDTWKRQDNAS